MSVKRSINTKIWSDAWIESLSPVEKLAWIYLLTNDYTNMLGIYRVSIKRMVFETGLTQIQIINAFKAFERVRKAYYWFEEWIILPNWIKNQSMNANMIKSAVECFSNLPIDLLSKLSEVGFESFESLSKGYLTLPNRAIPNLEVEYEYELECTKPNPSKAFEINPSIEPFWTEWKMYRKEIKKPIKPASEKLAYQELLKLSEEIPGNAKQIVERSIANGWQGLFPIQAVGENGKHKMANQNKTSDGMVY